MSAEQARALESLREAIHAVVKATQACAAVGHLEGGSVMMGLDVALDELRDVKRRVGAES